MTVTAICSVQFIWKDKLYAGHALCVVRHTFRLHNINNAQSVIRPSTLPPISPASSHKTEQRDSEAVSM